MKRLILILLVLIGFFTTVCTVEASGPVGISSLLRQAETKKLASNPYWMKLLHYRSKRVGVGSGLLSEIITPTFFLSKDGARDPSAELKATLAAFFKEPGEDPNAHPQCRFVARYKWLQKSLDWGELTPPKVNCELFDEWSKKGTIDSLSLIFVTGYLGNPASFYGHILFKFNARSDYPSNDLLDPSLNYGAILSGDNAVLYILNGLFGGYEGAFSHEKFYRHNHNYGEKELRDMWEYELDLTKEEIDRIVSHSWELLSNKYTYYFLKENCAYRMAELVELVVDEPLFDRRLPWTIPFTIFDRLISSEKNGRPVVKEVRRIISRQNRFYSKYSFLNKDEIKNIKELIDSDIELDNTAYRSMSDAGKSKVVETLFDYYEFRITSEDDDLPFKEAKRKLLIERLELGGESIMWEEVRKAPPHEGQLPTLVQVIGFDNSEYGAGVELRFRAAYYDFLSLDAGRLANSQVSMVDVRATYADDDLWLKRLDLLNIVTLNPTRTGLPGDGGLAWKLKFGLEDQDLSCKDCPVFSLNAGLGKSFAFRDNTVIYAMIEGRAQTPDRDSGRLAGTARVGLIGSPLDGWKTYFSAGYRIYLDDSEGEEPLFSWENRFGDSRRWDLRLVYEKHVAEEIKAALSLYW